MDVFATAVLHRSLSLSLGFCQMIRAENFICAAPLIRLQVDNLLRFHAAWLVPKPDEFAMAVVKGKEVRHFKDKAGEKMTDLYLRGKLMAQYPWINRLYKATSGYIHLSSQHVANAFCVDGADGEARFTMHIGNRDRLIPDSLRIEASKAMITVTQAVLKWVHDWAWTKDNPDALAALKKDAGVGE